jgi:hypothetical protein
MLDSKFDSVILGKNYLSLIFAILKVKGEDQSVLVINDPDCSLGGLWHKNLGEIEKRVLYNIGVKHNIQPLKQIKNYLIPTNTLIKLDEILIEFGQNPFSNIRELSRKLPECLPIALIDTIENYGEESFNKDCSQLLDDISTNIDLIGSKKDFHVTQSSLKIIYDQFLTFLESKSLVSEQLHYVLQVLFQSYFSNLKDEDGSRYLLTSLMSPRFNLDVDSLMKDLNFEFKSLGGSIIDACINSIEVYKNQFMFVELSTMDGIIKADDLYLFTKLREDIELKELLEPVEYKSISMTAPLSHEILGFYSKKRIIFSLKDNLGTDFPHFEMEINSEGLMTVRYSYASELGTKPSFFYKKAANSVFNSLTFFFPGLDKEEFLSKVEFGDGDSYWYQVLPNNKKAFLRNTSNSSLYSKETGNKVDNAHNFSHSRVQSMGLYSYLWEIAQL